MNMKRARFWRNLLLFSALSGAASLPPTHAQEGVSRVGNGTAGPGAAGVPTPEGFAPLSPSPYMPLDPGYNFPRPMPPALPPAQDTLRNSRRDAFGPRFDIGQFLGDRLGVADNDTNFNFLLPYLMGSENDVLFIDGRGVVTQLGQGAASAGLGFRSYDPMLNRLFGISGWVDYDQGHHRTYQQAGISFESLGTWMDVRVNGYIPFGTESNLVGSSIVGDPFFSGSGLFVNQRQLNESAYRGVDAEIGGPLPLLGRYGVSGYVGGYWLDSKTDKTAAGPRVRFEANVTDGARVSVTASDDPVFGTNAWVNLNLTLPDGRARRWFRPTEVQDRMLRTVERSYRVQTHTRVDLVPTPVLVAPPGTPNNPQGGFTGQPVRVIFVDPDRLTNGNGTLESPFNTFQGFANVAANTLIIVDGSPTDRPVTGTVSLFADQKLLSTSILAAGGVQLNTNLGQITLPSIPGFGDATPVSPILQNPAGGTLVTLGGNNIEVAGMTFDGSTSSVAIPNATGIAGSNFTDFNIHHNTFRDYSNAVVMSNARGVGLFQANTLTGTPGVSVDGFRLTNSGVGTLDLFVNSFEPPATGPGSGLLAAANTITGNDNAGLNITARNRAVINAHIVDNTISNNGQGVILDAAATRSVINASIVNNTIDGNRGEDRNLNGILDPGEDVNGDGVLNAGNGVLLMANASTLNLAQLGEDLNSNGILDRAEDTNGNGAIDTTTEDTNGNGILDAGEDTNGNGVIDTTTEDKNGNGVLDASEDANGNGILDGGYILSNNVITRNTGDGIAVVSQNNSIVNLTALRNFIGDPADRTSGNGGRGLSILADSGTVNANIGFLGNEDVNFNGVLDTGEDTNGNGVLDATNLSDGNFFTGNRGGGLLVDLSGTAVGNIVALNNVIGTGDGNLSFVINGQTTGSYSFTNDSQAGINLTGLTWDLAPAGLLFNTDTVTGTNAQDFTVSNASVAATGLTTVNGATGTQNATNTAVTFGVLDGATQVDLQLSGMISSDGALTTGEDTNGNGRLELVEDTSLSLPFSIDTDFANGAETTVGNNFIGSTVVATFSSGHTLSGTFQAVPGNASAAMFVPTSSASTIVTGPGIELRGSQAAVFNNPTIVQNDIRFQAGGGVVVRTTEDAQVNNLLVQDNILRNNGSTGDSGGVNLRTTAAATAQITGNVNANRFANNFGPGLLATADTGSINLTQIDNNTFDSNTNGIALNTLNGGTIATRIINNTISNSTSDGLVVRADTGSVTLNQLSDNTITLGGANGILLSALNGGVIDTVNGEDLNGNGVLDAGEDTNDNGFLDFGIRNNTITNPTGNGLFVNGTNGTYNLGTISGMTLDRTTSGTGGIVFDVTDSVTTGTFFGNTFTGGATNTNLGPGFNLTATNGTFDVTIGGANSTDRNVFTDNRGAGVVILAQNTAVGTFRIENNLFTGTRDDSEDNNGNGVLDTGEDINGNGILDGLNTPFSGQAIYTGTRTFGTLTPATALLNNPIILNNVIGDETNATLGNAGGGILVEIGQQSTLNGMTIDGNLVARNGTTAAGVTLFDTFNNSLAGITFNRTNDGVIDNVLIANNRILNNTYDGVYLHAFGGFGDVLDFTLIGNTIRGNNTVVATSPTFIRSGTAGLHLATEADSRMSTTLTDNLIENNLRNGIRLTSFEAADTDLESQTGTWTKNTIRGNQSHGIAIAAVMGEGTLSPLQIGLNGTDPADGRSLGNSITDNLQGGIEINLGGNVEINNNLIARNGANAGTGLAADTNGTGGIDINMLGGANLTDDTAPLRARIINNVIQENVGDGLEIVVSNAQSQVNGIPQSGSFTVLGNLISNNSIRGIDVLTQGSGTTNLRLGDGTLAGGNVISNHGQEGVYVVTTPSLTQSQQVSAVNALAADGPLIQGVPQEFPTTVLDVRQNNISGNNAVGTQVGNVFNFFSAGGLVVRDGTGGTVTTRISDNLFSGNNGDDVLLQTYTATAAPGNVGLIPFANLNVVFQNNTGESLEPNALGAVYTFNNIPIFSSDARVEAGFNTTGFANGGPGGSGEFSVPFPWTVVPAGTFSNNSFPNILFP